LKKYVFIFFCLVVLKAEAQASALVIADSLYTTGNFTAAINQYSKLNDQQAQLQIARAYNLVRNYDKAIVQYENYIANNPKDQIASFELGKLYGKTKKYTKAKEIFEKLVAKNNNNPEYYYYLADAFASLDAETKSIALYKKAIAVDSTHLRSIFEVAKYHVKFQDRDSVVKYADKGLRFYENDVSIINLKALALFNNDEFIASIPLFEKMIALGEKQPYIFERLGNAYFSLNNLEKAKENYKTSLFYDALNPNPKVLFNLGNVFREEKQLDSAAVYFQEAIDVQVVLFDKEYQALARIASEKKDFKNALKYYKLAHEEDPTNVVYFYQVCFVADRYYKDPKVKLSYYEQLLENYKGQRAYFIEFAQRRISELKEEIHTASE
tara:strand:- start:16121 stop:17266 length:1146 start_codon:yes stop_codon:yes gene_type:complete